MELVATSIEQLAATVAQAKKVSSVDLRALNRILEYTPEDLTVTVETGLTLAALQSALRERAQWLPIDPPHAHTTTIWDLLKFNLSGPRRHGFGTIREHLLGVRVVLADGRVVRSGGKVVKNVAGYDLLKLFVGDHGSLGITVEASFRVQPRPEAESFFTVRHDSLAQTASVVQSVLESPVTPCVLDLYRLQPDASFNVVIGLAGNREEVEWSMAEVAKLGFKDVAGLAYAESFWNTAHPAPPRRVSVLPSRLIETIRQIDPAAFVARAGNGVLYYAGGGTAPAGLSGPVNLLRRVKDCFDPKHLLPELPW